mmetsp:Transcript_60648/g.198442  ORF Transcript_60648/g.198442 Transcript_60648/m.198442 type:complete len:406 (+) Transcript_60648:435-1652(+)
MGCTKRTWLATVRLEPEAQCSNESTSAKADDLPAWKALKTLPDCMLPLGNRSTGTPCVCKALATSLSKPSHCTNTSALAPGSSARSRFSLRATAESFEPCARSAALSRLPGAPSSSSSIASSTTVGSASTCNCDTSRNAEGRRQCGQAGFAAKQAFKQCKWKMCAHGKIARELKEQSSSKQMTHVRSTDPLAPMLTLRSCCSQKRRLVWASSNNLTSCARLADITSSNRVLHASRQMVERHKMLLDVQRSACFRATACLSRCLILRSVQYSDGRSGWQSSTFGSFKGSPFLFTCVIRSRRASAPCTAAAACPATEANCSAKALACGFCRRAANSARPLAPCQAAQRWPPRASSNANCPSTSRMRCSLRLLTLSTASPADLSLPPSSPKWAQSRRSRARASRLASW